MLLLFDGIGCCSLSLSVFVIVKTFSSAFGCFVKIWWFLMALVVWCLWSETLSGTCWFHLCIQLCSCWLGISSGRLYQFSVHLKLDLLDACLKS